MAVAGMGVPMSEFKNMVDKIIKEKGLSINDSQLKSYCFTLKDRLALRLFKLGPIDAKISKAASEESQAYFFNEAFSDLLYGINTANPDKQYASIDEIEHMFFMDEFGVDANNSLQKTLVGKEDSKIRMGIQMAGDKQPMHLTAALTTSDSGSSTTIPPFLIHSGGIFDDKTNMYERKTNDYDILKDPKYKDLNINGVHTKNGSMEKGKYC